MPEDHRKVTWMIGCDCPELHQHPLSGDRIFLSMVTRLDLGIIAIDDDAVDQGLSLVGSRSIFHDQDKA